MQVDYKETQGEELIGGQPMYEKMNQNPAKFINKRHPANLMSKKNAHLYKMIIHANDNSLVEPGGREIRSTDRFDQNPRFNYKQSIVEGESKLTSEDQIVLGMQPVQYTVYLRNLA